MSDETKQPQPVERGPEPMSPIPWATVCELLRGCVRQRSSREMFAEHRDYFEYQITDKGVDWGSDG